MSSTSNNTLESSYKQTNLNKGDGEELVCEMIDNSILEQSTSKGSEDSNGIIENESVDQIEEQNIEAVDFPENDNGHKISNDPYLGADADPFFQSTDTDFKNMFKVSRSTFENLVEFLSNEELEPIENIPLYKKLLIVLWLIGNSGSYSDAAKMFSVSDEATSNCFFDICATLYNQCDNIITWPDFDECDEIALRIEKNYGFPGVVGVVGCRYFSISIPKEAFSRREHFNAKNKMYSVALQIVCDDNLMIRDIFPGLPGGVTETQIFCRSPLFDQLTDKTQPVQLIDSHKHILARSIYPQLKSVLTPYSEVGTLSQEELELNKLHENVCLLVDQTLQMLIDRFSMLKLLDPEVATMVLVVASVIHNFCVINGDLFGVEN